MDFDDDFDGIDDFEDDIFTVKGRTLLIDGDILLYRPCCVFNEDTDESREATVKLVQTQVNELLAQSGSEDFRFFVTGKKNYRNFITEDYKANRKDVERPINLKWVKTWCVDNLGAEYVLGMEADDLLSINQTDTTVIWSTDKDLRQVKGLHLNDASREVIEVTEFGLIERRGKKVHFEGTIGLYLQILTGDSTDNIIGCGKKFPNKNGDLRRKGIGAVAALNLLQGCETLEEARDVLKQEYQKLHGGSWLIEINKQGRLLHMIEEFDNDSLTIKLWNFYSDKEEFMNLKTGEIFI